MTEKENEELKLKEIRRIAGRYGEIEIHDLINKTLSKDYISIDKIKERIEQLNKEIKEFKAYVADSIGEERQFYKKQLGQLVSARNELQELLEGDE